MDKIFALIIGIVFFIIEKIFEFFHITKSIRVIIGAVSFFAICYAIWPILSFIFKLFGFIDSDNTESENSLKIQEKMRKEREYQSELDRLNRLRRTNQMSEADYYYWKNDLESKYRR